MSTIASPRDHSTSSRRLPQALSTPTSSSRPSLDSPRFQAGVRSSSASPNRGPNTSNQPARRNRAALREYYNLQQKAAADDGGGNGDLGSEYADSEVRESEMDREGFDGEAWVKEVLETKSLEDLMRTYNSVLTDIRALDAEKKALVYDNYSKLISATDTIRRMRATMDPLNPMAATLDPAIAAIYERANAVKRELRDSMTSIEKREGPDEDSGEEVQRRRKIEIARKVLSAPGRIRELVAEGREEEAQKLWDGLLPILETWKERGVGGTDVIDCIADGEAALRGEGESARSWRGLRSS